MSNNNFSESFQAYTNKFTKVDWQEWGGNFHEQNTQNIAYLQNFLDNNSQNLRRNTQLLIDTMKNNISAKNLQEAVANQYTLLKDVATNNVENLKEALENASINVINNYSSVTNSLLEQMQKYVDLNHNNSK
jgi:hypothetical protein